MRHKKSPLKRIVTLSVLLAAVLLVVYFTPSGIIHFLQEKVTAFRIGTPRSARSISGDRYAYSKLNEEERAVYDQVLDCIMAHREADPVSTREEGLLKKAVECVFADYGELFWVDGYHIQTYQSDDYVSGINFIPSYVYTKEDREALFAEIQQVVSQWTSQLPPDSSDYEKSKFVFEKLISEVDYEKGSPDNQNIISVFLNKRTVCQGYAAATAFLLNGMGVQTTIINGTARNEPHAWNLVRLDGEYYLSDSTWGNSSFLAGNSSPKMIDYAFLNATDADFRDNHFPEMEFELPVCDSIANSYFVKEGKYFDKFDPDSFGPVIGEAYSTGADSVSLKFSSKELFDQSKMYLLDEKHFTDYCPGLHSIYYIEDMEQEVLTLRFSTGEAINE